MCDRYYKIMSNELLEKIVKLIYSIELVLENDWDYTRSAIISGDITGTPLDPDNIHLDAANLHTFIYNYKEVKAYLDELRDIVTFYDPNN